MTMVILKRNDYIYGSSTYNFSYNFYVFNDNIIYFMYNNSSFLFKQGRDFSNKYEGKVYITLDNHSILINNQCIFSIKSKQSQKFNYKIIEKIEVVKIY